MKSKIYLITGCNLLLSFLAGRALGIGYLKNPKPVDKIVEAVDAKVVNVGKNVYTEFCSAADGIPFNYAERKAFERLQSDYASLPLSVQARYKQCYKDTASDFGQRLRERLERERALKNKTELNR